MRKIFLLLLTVVLAACNLPRFSSALAPATDTPEYQPCYYNWDTQSLPDLSAQIQAAIQAAGLTNVTADAEAYGESCYDAQINKPLSFSAMETDFRVTARVQTLTDKDQLGNLLEQILIVLDGFPTEMTPGPQPGYIGVTFQAGSEELQLWFTFTDGESARATGLHSRALLEDLQK